MARESRCRHNNLLTRSERRKWRHSRAGRERESGRDWGRQRCRRRVGGLRAAFAFAFALAGRSDSRATRRSSNWSGSGRSEQVAAAFACIDYSSDLFEWHRSATQIDRSVARIIDSCSADSSDSSRASGRRVRATFACLLRRAAGGNCNFSRPKQFRLELIPRTRANESGGTN